MYSEQQVEEGGVTQSLYGTAFTVCHICRKTLLQVDMEDILPRWIYVCAKFNLRTAIASFRCTVHLVHSSVFSFSQSSAT